MSAEPDHVLVVVYDSFLHTRPSRDTHTLVKISVVCSSGAAASACVSARASFAALYEGLTGLTFIP